MSRYLGEKLKCPVLKKILWDSYITRYVIVADTVTHPYLLPDRLTAHQHRDFLETVLLVLLEDVPLVMRQTVVSVLRNPSAL
jgi:hypothetical protein